MNWLAGPQLFLPPAYRPVGFYPGDDRVSPKTYAHTY